MDGTPELIGVLTEGSVISDTPELIGVLTDSSILNGTLAIPSESSFVLQPATNHSLGGIIVGDDLLITPEGVLSVHKANEVEADNTLPITAAAVYAEVGNINALLATI